MFSECMRLHNIQIFFPGLLICAILYVVSSKLEHVSVAADAKELGRIQRKFASVFFCCCFELYFCFREIKSTFFT
jgi:hypothetical protein